MPQRDIMRANDMARSVEAKVSARRVWGEEKQRGVDQVCRRPRGFECTFERGRGVWCKNAQPLWLRT